MPRADRVSTRRLGVRVMNVAPDQVTAGAPMAAAGPGLLARSLTLLAASVSTIVPPRGSSW